MRSIFRNINKDHKCKKCKTRYTINEFDLCYKCLRELNEKYKIMISNDKL